MSNKKWYNYFVVTTPAETASETAGAAAPPRRVTDIVPDADAETTFAAPVTTPTDLAEIYTVGADRARPRTATPC